MSVNPNRSAEAAETAAEVFDRLHLNSYSMQNQELAAEILGLFLLQLPAMLQALDEAVGESGWAFATHTLKGSAALVGARKLHLLAAELDSMAFPGDPNVRLLRVQAVKAAAAEFRQAAGQTGLEAD
jgi:hypothetical protein